MDYCTTCFNKTLANLEYQDIENFFHEPREESTRLEFKSFPQKGDFNKCLEGVIIGICAFLNSEGGILIWGAPVGIQTQGQHTKIFQGHLSPLSETKEKDWLINKISDVITPMPIGINVVILQNAGNVLYIFEVQQSNYSPHQTKNTYYARLDGQTRPAPHYLIEALFNKITYPNIEGYINFDNYGNYPEGGVFLDITIILLNFSELINERNLSFRLTCPQAIFEASRTIGFAHHYCQEGHEFVGKGFINVLHFGASEHNQQRLIFDPMVLQRKHNSELQLILSFGGEQSPLKISEYTISFGGAVEPARLYKSIKNKEENVLSSDMQKQLGTTKEMLLKEILKR